MPGGRKDAAAVSKHTIILSCEHAGNRVPPRYKYLFASDPSVLTTHRAVDIGIFPVAIRLRSVLKCPLCLYGRTRLLIDVNRTRTASQFSEYSSHLNESDKQHLIDAYDRPYKKRLHQMVAEQLEEGPVLHFSLHSFTPVLNGRKRNADIGLLYDPSRQQESDYAKGLQSRLREATALRVRRNYPYLGRDDGVATWLRKQFAQTRYLGIELELNQALLKSLTSRKRTSFIQALGAAL